MAEGLAFDTSFLIDLQRELRHGQKGPAQYLLQAESEKAAHLSVVALGEFSEGFSDLNHPILVEVRRSFVLLDVNEATVSIYAGITRALRVSGQLIGANDLWIAASALQHQLPLVTRDSKHFARVDGLSLVHYQR